MSRQLIVEWKHLDKNGETCSRCSNTGKNLNRLIKNLATKLESQGIKIVLKETTLSAAQINESNTILFNGKALEEILGNAKKIHSTCDSCACLTGKNTDCRAIEYQGKTYEEIPEELIKRAIAISTGLQD